MHIRMYMYMDAVNGKWSSVNFCWWAFIENKSRRSTINLMAGSALKRLMAEYKRKCNAASVCGRKEYGKLCRFLFHRADSKPSGGNSSRYIIILWSFPMQSRSSIIQKSWLLITWEWCVSFCITGPKSEENFFEWEALITYVCLPTSNIPPARPHMYSSLYEP